MIFDLNYKNPDLPLVVTIVSERCDILTYFINFYLERNFNILLVLDQTMNANSFSMKLSEERVKIINFTKKSYNSFEQSSISFTSKQRVVYNKIMPQTNCDLAFICDADELCDVDAHTMTKFFAKHDDLISLQLTPWEVFYNFENLQNCNNIYSGNYCRRPYNRMEKIVLFLPTLMAHGLNYRFLNRGIMSHANGKQFVRILKNGRFSYGVHSTYDNEHNKKITKRWKSLSNESEPILYHFDVISKETWIKKWNRKCENLNIFNGMRKKRMRFALKIYKANDSQKHELFKRFYCLPEWFIRFGIRLKFVRKIKFK